VIAPRPKASQPLTTIHGDGRAKSLNWICSIGSSIPVSSARATSSLVSLGALVLIWVLQDWATFIHSYKDSLITPWNPGIGILFAVIVRDGMLYGLGLFVGVVCAEFVTRGDALGLLVTLMSAAIIAIAYTSAAVIARRAINVELRRLRDSVILILTGMSSAFVVAILLSLLLIGAGRFDFDDLFPSIVRSFVGDAIGIAVVSPLILRFWYLRRQLTPERIRSAVPEAVVYMALITAGLWAILDTRSQHGSNFFYLLFLPVIIAAVRQGFDGACFSLLVTQIGLVLLLQRFSFGAEAFTEFQTLMFVLTATALSVGAIVSEREQVRRAFVDAEERLKKREGQAIRAGRFSLVNGMASALAHEINQPITAARALARSAQHILNAAAPDLSRAETNIATSIIQIDAAAGTIRRMREFLRRGHPSIGEVNICHLVDDALMLLQPELAMTSVRVETLIEANLPTLHGDRGQLEQLILNLVRNSIEAITGMRRQDGCVTVVAQHSRNRSNLEISVQDNGPGVAAEIVDRIFEPLTSSKEEGLGLGLSICLSIVEAHGGRLWLERSAFDGTEFRLSIPFRSKVS
jgi:two-component system, LuxR family, sensor kinase FixL